MLLCTGLSEPQSALGVASSEAGPLTWPLKDRRGLLLLLGKELELLLPLALPDSGALAQLERLPRTTEELPAAELEGLPETELLLLLRWERPEEAEAEAQLEEEAEVEGLPLPLLLTLLLPEELLLPQALLLTLLQPEELLQPQALLLMLLLPEALLLPLDSLLLLLLPLARVLTLLLPLEQAEPELDALEAQEEDSTGE